MTWWKAFIYALVEGFRMCPGGGLWYVPWWRALVCALVEGFTGVGLGYSPS